MKSKQEKSVRMTSELKKKMQAEMSSVIILAA